MIVDKPYMINMIRDKPHVIGDKPDMTRDKPIVIKDKSTDKK